MAARRSQRGLTLIELMLAVAVAAIVLGGLSGVLLVGLEAQASGRQANEVLYQGRFAMDRMIAKARATAPKLLTTPLAGTSGDWFSPTMYCLQSGDRLVETTVSDAACTGSSVIAESVIAFSAQLPSGAGPLDEPVAVLSLTLQSGGAPIALTTSVRLGGGAL